MGRRAWLWVFCALFAIFPLSCTAVLGDFSVTSQVDAGDDGSGQDVGPGDAASDGHDAADAADAADTADTSHHDAKPDGPTFTLTVTMLGTGTGTVTSSDGSINCPGACSASLPPGTQVTLTGTPDASSAFLGWSGGTCSGSGTCSITLNADTMVDASFGLQHSITVTLAGNGGGKVTSSPAGIDCGATCSYSWAPGTQVTLTATPSTGSDFAGWSGGACSGTGTCSITLNADTPVTATFTLQKFPLNISLAGKGSGNVKGSPGAIDCGNTCSDTFDYGTQVTLTATPDSHSTFVGWSGGGCGGTGTCQVTISAATSVTATFALQQFTLTVTIAGNSNVGSVSSQPGGISCPGTCTAKFDYGTSVNLYIGYSWPTFFAGWSGGACSGTGNPCNLSIQNNTSVTATYEVPTTWDPNWTGGGVNFTNGNLSIACPNNQCAASKEVRTLVGHSSGKWYWEVTATGGSAAYNNGGIGLCDSNFPNSSPYIGSDKNSIGFGYASGIYYWNWTNATLPYSTASGSPAINANNIYMFALDMGAGYWWAGQNGTWYNNGDPAAGTNPQLKGISGTLYSGVTFYSYANDLNAFTANFGMSGFNYGVPSGFAPGF